MGWVLYLHATVDGCRAKTSLAELTLRAVGVGVAVDRCHVPISAREAIKDEMWNRYILTEDWAVREEGCV